VVFLISRKCPNIELLLDFTRKNMNLLFWERMKIRRSKLNRRPFLIYKNVLVPFGLFFALRFCQKIIFVPTVWSKVLFFLQLVTLGYERGSQKKWLKKKRESWQMALSFLMSIHFIWLEKLYLGFFFHLSCEKSRWDLIIFFYLGWFYILKFIKYYVQIKSSLLRFLWCFLGVFN